MTTCVYCEKDIDKDGYYDEEYECPKIQKEACNKVCIHCKYYIEEGKEVPVK